MPVEMLGDRMELDGFQARQEGCSLEFLREENIYDGVDGVGDGECVRDH